MAGQSAGKAHVWTSRSKADDAEILSALTSIGGVLFVVALAAIVRFDHARLAIFATFVFMLSLAPVLAAGLVYLRTCMSPTGETASHAALAIVKLFLLGLLIALISSTLAKSRAWPGWIVPWHVVIVALLIASVTAVRHAGDGPWWRSASVSLDPWLIVAVAVAVFLLSPFDPNPAVPVGLLSYALGAADFGYWLLLAAAWTVAGIWLHRHEGWAFRGQRKFLETLAIMAALLFIASLYDDTHFVDFGHYAPIVGPAMHASRGGIPMVDVYSPYGLLPWLVHRAAFAVFEPGFGTAAVVLRIINIAYFTVVLLILLSVVRRRISALWFLVPALLVAITSHNPGPDGMWNMNSLPMTLGGRWLLPAAMALVLIAGRGRSWSLGAELALIMLGSLASVEILAFTLAPWSYCLLIKTVRLRSPGHLFKRLGLALIAIAGAHALFVAAVYLSTGAIVDYGPYFNMFAQFQPSEASVWSTAFVPYYALWFPIACAYFIILAAGVWRALNRDPSESLIERLLPIAALGLGPLAYFFGRPQEGTLNVACTTFAIVAIASAETVFYKARRLGPAGPAMATTLAVAFTFTAADGFEHFMRPFDPSKGNATVLRRCFSDGGCKLAEVPRNIGLALHTQPLDPRTSVGYFARSTNKSERIEEAIALLRRWAPDAARVTMLTDSFPNAYADSDTSIGIASFMATGQWFAWAVSSPINDSSFEVIRGISARAAVAPSGSPVLISNSFINGSSAELLAPGHPKQALSQRDVEQIARDSTLTGQKFLAAATYRQREDLVPVNQAILTTLARRCDFRLLERGRQHSIYVTEHCLAPVARKSGN
jgi:hypothetical protein